MTSTPPVSLRKDEPADGEISSPGVFDLDALYNDAEKRIDRLTLMHSLRRLRDLPISFTPSSTRALTTVDWYVEGNRVRADQIGIDPWFYAELSGRARDALLVRMLALARDRSNEHVDDGLARWHRGADYRRSSPYRAWIDAASVTGVFAGTDAALLTGHEPIAAAMWLCMALWFPVSAAYAAASRSTQLAATETAVQAVGAEAVVELLEAIRARGSRLDNPETVGPFMLVAVCGQVWESVVGVSWGRFLRWRQRWFGIYTTPDHELARVRRRHRSDDADAR
ncbi:hypothetical protein [Nocardia camponoti]|uniref:Uncharacterized protein n=1 Tax=Nocardia camponoti TaxID=1616106 RepID=A0A917QVD3_9NOCA|nr:hypothetical protein [Nocardia camponoti]GGK69318.1 hypothetical protein GCM10011591_46800 [Nocardia camponoti]